MHVLMGVCKCTVYVYAWCLYIVCALCRYLYIVCMMRCVHGTYLYIFPPCKHLCTLLHKCMQCWHIVCVHSVYLCSHNAFECLCLCKHECMHRDALWTNVYKFYALCMWTVSLSVGIACTGGVLWWFLSVHKCVLCVHGLWGGTCV
jgi:hypothetical protein